MDTGTARSAGPLLLAGIAGTAHLAVGYVYLTSGLAVPGYVLIPLWVFWLFLAAWLIRLAIERSWWTPAVPVGAAAVLALTLVVGGTVLGWQA